MEKIVMSVEELAEILKQVRELPDGVIGDEYCSVCREMHDNDCPVSSDKDCPHDEIVEYRYFVRQHYKRFIKRNCNVSDECLACSEMANLCTESDMAYLVAQAGVQLGLSIINALKYGVNDGKE